MEDNKDYSGLEDLPNEDLPRYATPCAELQPVRWLVKPSSKFARGMRDADPGCRGKRDVSPRDLDVHSG